MILHVTTTPEWHNAISKGSYTAASLSLEGFIHCCLPEQLSGVIARYYQHVPGLLLLHIDEQKLQAPLQYELSPAINEWFPHVYGMINIDSVTATEPLPLT